MFVQPYQAGVYSVQKHGEYFYIAHFQFNLIIFQQHSRDCHYQKNNNNKYSLQQRMSEDKMDHQEDPKGASRRSRKDEQGRDYVCGCGKRYLSYPALYTHIKTKHDGHQPEGTQKTGVAPVSRRAKQKIDDKVLKEICNLVQLQNLKILTQLDENAHGFVPLSNRIKKENVGKQIVQAYQNISKLNSLTIDKKSSLESILVCYLIGAGQYTSEALFHYYCHFSRLFRNCFHDCGQQVYDACFKNNDKRKDKFLNTQQCKMVPIICDFFLRFYVPYENKDIDFQSVMELLCYDFCQWMYFHKFTIVQISMKKDYVVSRKNLIEAKSKQKDKKSEEGHSIDQENDKQDKQESELHHSSVNESEEDKNEQINQIEGQTVQKNENMDEMEDQNNQNQDVPNVNNSQNQMINEKNQQIGQNNF